MILFLIIPIAALVYFFFAVIHYYYWQHYFHEHDLCTKKTYGGCLGGCEIGAMFSSLIWPIWPFVFFVVKCIYQLPRATYLAGKSVGNKLTKVGKNA
jgi:hypothetical protein